MTNTEKSHLSAQDKLLERLLKKGEVGGFAEFVSLADGKHPIELLQGLLNYAGQDPDLAHRARVLIDEARAAVEGNGHPQGAGLALPHPIDAEWRFTDATAKDLLQAAVEATRPGDSILLMGVPSIAVAALHSKYERRFAVVGEPNIITDGLLGLTAEDGRFDHATAQEHRVAAVILDPPWYLDHFCGMLRDASQRCKIGAKLFVSEPSEGVRPSIVRDLRLIGETATRAGLKIVQKDIGALTYRTPFFELNALRASGIGAWLPAWRRGNLAVYQKQADRATQPSVSANRSGFEVTLSGIRLRLLDDGRSGAELTPIHSGEIFPSVSMRAPRRSEASLWTSGNRAFSVDYSTCLAALIAVAKARGLLPKGLDPKLSLSWNPKVIDGIEPLIQKLTRLAEREFAEAVTVLGTKAWETAANDARFLSGSRTAYR